MSGIYIWCEVTCSTCAHALDGEFTSGAIARRKMTKAVRDTGWIIEAPDVYCSQRCFEKSIKDDK